MRVYAYLILCLSMCGCAALSMTPSKPEPKVYKVKERIAVLDLKSRAGVKLEELN